MAEQKLIKHAVRTVSTPDRAEKEMNALGREGYQLHSIAMGGTNGEKTTFVMRKVEVIQTPDVPELGESPDDL